MTIKHVVISGGGPSALISYGIYKTLCKSKYLNIDNIESFYGASSGGILSVILMLNIEFDVLDDYLLKRPWDKVFDIKENSKNYDLIYYLTEKGIDGENFLKLILEPLFTSKNIDINITLSEFYNLTKKNLYIYGANLNNGNKITEVEISHTTYPDMSLLKALTITSSVPFIFKPVIYDDMCLVDGGLLNNFPLNNCLERNNEKEIFAIKTKSNSCELNITDKTDFLDYLKIILKKTHNTITKKNNKIKNMIICYKSDLTNLEKWYDCLIENNIRIQLIKEGIMYAKNYLHNINYYEVVDSINSTK